MMVELAFWWAWVITVAVSLSDLPLLVMDEHFGLLVHRSLPGKIDGLVLSVKLPGNFLISRTSHSPTIPMWDNVLVFTFRHDYSPLY
jgi:hypothetical protein